MATYIDGFTNHSFDVNSYNNVSHNITLIAKEASQSGPGTLMRFICNTGVALPLSILGIMGNILAIVVLQKHRNRLSTTVLLQALAVADTSVLLSTIFLRSLRYLYYYTDTFILEPYMSIYPYIFRTCFPMVYFIRLTGTWITVLLTIDRYIAVRYPLHAHRLCTVSRAIRNVIILSVFALLFSMPRFFEYEIDHDAKFGFNPTPLLKSSLYTFAYRIAMFFTFMYLLPMILLIVLNAHLLFTLRVAELHRAVITDSKGSNKSSRSITATVVTVVLVTIVCNVSAMLSHLLWSLTQCFTHLSYLDHHRRYMALMSNIFVTINSAVNFVIYCLCSENFRRVLKSICGCRKRSQSYGATLSRQDTSTLTVHTTGNSPIAMTFIKKSSRFANGKEYSSTGQTHV